MHVHILGICGTFMGSLALLARELGHQVSGSDAGVYPPMSTQLAAHGIELREGYDPAHLQPEPDLVIIGNALSRGNPAVEYVLDRGLRYTSGPQWLSEQLLQKRWVLAAAGTHGKTTTSSLLAWLLEANGYQPGFLIGGVPDNFGRSAQLGSSDFFVIEADEYDSAFFDKRSKFVHYRPRTAILNNLEFDHADIFPDLAAIETQFHHLVRTIPSSGLIVAPANDEALARVLQRGCWSERVHTGSPQGWHAGPTQPDGSFDVFYQLHSHGTVRWAHTGAHNRANALAAIAAAAHAGVDAATAVDALTTFIGVRRRMELRGEVGGVAVYDDFAHHPTAIATTLAGLHEQTKGRRILAVLEPRSNTMKLGTMSARLPAALQFADHTFCYAPRSGPGAIDWDASAVLAPLGQRASSFEQLDPLVDAVLAAARPGDQILVMSNGSFGGVHERILQRLAQLQTTG